MTTRQPNRRGQGDQLRAELVDAASGLLEQVDGAEALSLRAVARAAGVAPQSVYLHFADKPALIAAVCEARFADLHTTLDATPSATPRARLRAMCLAYCDYALANPGQYRVLFSGPIESPDRAQHGVATLGLLLDAVRACDKPTASGGARAIALWAALHGIVTLRRDRPDFPWPPLAELIDTLLPGTIERRR
jgi:AcrR family transcriptional regulator